MLTETQKARILVKIDALRTEKTELEHKLQEEKDFNVAAWNQYGSELCSKSMVAKEMAIDERIADVEKKINILEQYLVGAFSASERTQIFKLKMTTDEAIKELEAKKLKLQESLDKFILLEALLMQIDIK
ncbi:MAG: hypothetical protein HYV51_03290 [Parcubacteria group bacterium]|nr:hypothetical protein [Parcubacteria group bacterium]